MTSWKFWEAVRWDLPAVVMVAMLLIFAWTLYRTQLQTDFNFADMYRGDDGKPSTGRLVAVGAWVVSSWVVMQDTLDGVPTPELYWAYVIAWSAAKPLEKFADKWNGTLPLAKTP
jgi:hypothetical protein